MLHKVTTLSHFPDDPARLSPELAGLFPPGVVAAAMDGPGDPSRLLPEEFAGLGRAVPKRQGEFAAGRLCARLALAAVGITGFALRAGEDRQPLWPAAAVGSISHTTGLCVAVVGLKRQFQAIGVDCEVVGHVGDDLRPTLCTPAESAGIAALPERLRSAAAALIFSAKEAFYKAQYPLTGEWLDFHDLEVESWDWGAEKGGFTLRETRPLAASRLGLGAAVCRYLVQGGRVTTGVTWTRDQ